jgi:RNA polymerase sigma-70 factor (ECF subfamily)
VPTLEELFDRFRSKGDADALGEVYDRTAGQLLRGAMHLARSPAAAEDLLQATFVAAIERRDSYDAARPLVPWLLGILANQARLAHWREGRAPDPQRLAARAARGPLELAQETEFTAALDEAIAALPEIYQPVLVLHLRHGMPGIEIAHALRRPPGTVRAQLARGLDKLRDKLPAGIAGGLAISASAGRGLAAVRAAVLAHASAGAPAAIGAGALALAPTTWGLLAMKKTLLGVAAGVAAIGLWWMSGPSIEAYPAADASPHVGVALAARGDAREPDASAAPPERETAAPRETLAAESAVADMSTLDNAMPVLRGVVRFAHDATPAADVSVWCQEFLDRDFERRITRTDAEGRFSFGRLVTGPTLLGTDRGDEKSLWLTASTGEVELLIPAGCLVTGTVRDPDRRPIARAEIWLSERFSTEQAALVATTDDGGRFRVRDVAPDRYLGARAAGYRPSPVHYVQAQAGETLEFDLRLLAGDAMLRGRVFDARGRPVARARVRVCPPGRAPYVSTTVGSIVRAFAPAFTVAAEDGAFELRGLTPGRLSVQARATGHGAFETEIEVAAGATSEVTATLPAAATVHGRVTDAAGAAVAGAQVRAGRAWDDFMRNYAITDAEGAYALEVVMPREATLAVLTDGRIAAQTVLSVGPGQALQWDPVLGTRPAITGRVVDSAHSPLSGWQVAARLRDDTVARAVTDRDGRFAFLDLALEPHELRVARVARLGSTAGVHVGEIVALVETGVVPGDPELLLEIPEASLLPSSVRGRLLPPAGKTLAHPRISIGSMESKGVVLVRVDTASCAFDVQDLMPGPYWISAHADGYPSIRIGRHELAPGQELDLGELAFAEGSIVTGTLRGIDPETRAQLELQIVDERHEKTGAVQHDGARFRSTELAPGPYRLLLRGAGAATAAVPFQIAAGVETTCDVEVAPGTRQMLRARLPEGMPAPRWLWMTLIRGEEMLGGQGFDVQPGGSYTTELWLGPGTYEVWIGDPSSACHGHCKLTVAAQEGGAPETLVQLESQ